MASVSSAALLFCLLSIAATAEFTSNGNFGQSLSYSGSSGSGSGSVPSVPSYGGGSGGGTPSSGSGSVPSGGGGSYGGGAPSDGSGSGSIPSGGGVPSDGSGSGSIPSGGSPSYGGGSGDGSVPSVGSGSSPSGGIPGFGGGSGGIPTVPSTGGGTSPAPSSGCSCDFWAAHVNSWPDPMQIISTVSAIFGGLASNAFGPSTTLLTALHNTKPDPYSQLLRQGTAAMLNAYARPHFVYTPVAVRSQFNAALVSSHAAAVQAAKFANANRGYGTNTLCA